mgnify:CR=1 FL=1
MTGMWSNALKSKKSNNLLDIMTVIMLVLTLVVVVMVLIFIVMPVFVMILTNSGFIGDVTAVLFGALIAMLSAVLAVMAYDMLRNL